MTVTKVRFLSHLAIYHLKFKTVLPTTTYYKFYSRFLQNYFWTLKIVIFISFKREKCVKLLRITFLLKTKNNIQENVKGKRSAMFAQIRFPIRRTCFVILKWNCNEIDALTISICLLQKKKNVQGSERRNFLNL